MTMDKEQFDNYLEAHKKNLGPDFVKRWQRFFNTLQTANRMYKSCFSGVEGPGNPGEMQGTLLLAKLEQEMDAVNLRMQNEKKGEENA